MSFNSPFTGQVIQPTDVSYRSIALVADEQLTWPLNGSVLDDAAARIMDVSSNSASNSLLMPPANQTSVGQDALIRNTGAYDVTVKDYLGVNTIVLVEPGKVQYIYITDNSTEAGTWGIIAFGVGTSNVDATTLAGYGLKAISNTLNGAYSVATFSSAYTAVAADRASARVWTGGAGTFSLTGPSTLGDDWYVLVRNSGTGTLTVTPNSGLINGLSSISMQPSDSCIIACSGTAFYTIGLGQTSQFNFTQLTYAVTAGSYTLTSAEAASVIQKFTGTLSADVTIVLPPTVQVYYITNQTDGTASAYTITFTVDVGGATAVVPANEQVILVCDSVNLLNASTIAAGATSLQLIDGSVVAPALSFSSDPTTGIYRPASGSIGIAVLGEPVFEAFYTSPTVAGIEVEGTGNFTLGVLGGTF